MLTELPDNIYEFMEWPWEKVEPYYKELEARELTAENVVDWLKDWAVIVDHISETYSRRSVATTLDTTDEVAEAKFTTFIESVFPPAMIAEQKLKEKLLATGLKPEGYEITLRNLAADAEIFREENVPLMTEEQKLGQEYDKIAGAQTVQWRGEEKTLSQLLPFRLDQDRSVREAAWRAAMGRTLQDRAAFNDLWTRFLKLRLQMAKNAGMDYRAMNWKSKYRFDYTPEDCYSFHKAIEEAVVPAAARIYEKRRQMLGVDSLRPWDSEHQIHVDPTGKPALKPYEDVSQLISVSSGIFHKVDDQLGDYYDIMMEERLLDLDNRKGKAPGGYCTTFEVSKRPFIFQNAVGIHDDVQTLLHEGGHAFHAFEMFQNLPAYRRGMPPIEFCEVASMSMELLAAPYLAKSEGGFYSAADTARARIEHLEGVITFWPYMAVVDAFQQWVYTHPEDAMNPDNCDEEWSKLWDRFMVGIDYSGLEDIKATGWHRKLHIFQIPFYYVEYGIAQLGAVQVYGNSLKDQSSAIANYRKAMALGGTAGLPDLFATAGAKFALDTPTLSGAVSLVEGVIHDLEPAMG